MVMLPPSESVAANFAASRYAVNCSSYVGSVPRMSHRYSLR